MNKKILILFFSINIFSSNYFDSSVTSDFTNVAGALELQFSATTPSGSLCSNAILNGKLSTIQNLPTLSKISPTMAIKDFLRYYCFYTDGSDGYPNINQYMQITAGADASDTCYWPCPCTNSNLKTANIVLPSGEATVTCPTSSSTSSTTTSDSQESSGSSSGGSGGASLGTEIGVPLGILGGIATAITIYKVFHNFLKNLAYKSNTALELKALKAGNVKAANYFGNRAKGTTDVDEVEFAQIFRRVLFKKAPIQEKYIEITYKVIKQLVEILGDSGTDDAALNEELANLINNIKIASSENKISKSSLVAKEINKGQSVELSRLSDEQQEKLLKLFESNDFKAFLKIIKGSDIETKYNANVLPNLKTFLTGERILNYDAIEESLKGYLTKNEEDALKALKGNNRAVYEKIIKQIVDIASSRSESIKIGNTETTKTPEQLIDIILKTLSDQIEDGKIPTSGFKFIFDVTDTGSNIFQVNFNKDYGMLAKDFNTNFPYQKSVVQQGYGVIKSFTTKKIRSVENNNLTGDRWENYDIRPIYHGEE